MLSTDIRILEVRCAFAPETFRVPLQLSSGPIHECVYAHVEVDAENRRGARATGIGGVYLSDLWAFQGTALPRDAKVRAMEAVVSALARRLEAANDCLDAMQWGRLLEHELDAALIEAARSLELPLPIPGLAGLVCGAPLDAALHDAWGRANGRSTYAMYGEHFLNEDLSADFGSGWEGRYPGSDLAAQPAPIIAVQHVVGAGDPLTALDAQGAARPEDGLPFTLEEWIRKERVTALKIKTKGIAVQENIERIGDIYAAARAAADSSGVKAPIRLSLDPNEGFPHPDPLVELLRGLRETRREAFDALEYIEQPTPRDLAAYDFTLHEVAALKPVIIDESLDRLDRLPALREQGWSGVALKTCKGHTHTLSAYCWAKRNGMYITLQDLTNPGMAHVQSAHLFSRLAVSCDVFEFNSRQYTPYARSEERQRFPSLFEVQDGRISTRDIRGIGLY